MQKQLIAERYAHMGWEMPRLLTYMWEAPDFHFDSGAQIHMDSWSTGRVVLLGDAGYCGSPASGQGSSMAMVAAHVLAGQLKAADGDHRRAFAAYERELRPWVTANQALADRQIDRAENAGNAEKSSEESGGGENSLPTFVDDDFYAVVDDFILPDHGEQGATAR
ncbi:FAD-dependent monooxygenase [Streptomyces smyrnaeus]|uniref:FAD-dependent monooxygenase n=1 Tax=Streptomyces smyrnaeus TaxID=1387713 RepID=UPI0036A49C7A